MAKNSQVNIRFDDGTASDLEKTAAGLGISVSALVRHLTKTYLEEVKATGSLKLKPEWLKMLGGADARSGWGERKLDVARTTDEPGDLPGNDPDTKTIYPAPPARKKTKG